MNRDKPYGLILPNKTQLSAPKASNIFCDEDDSDDNNGIHSIEINSKACVGNTSRVKKQVRLDIQKALADDPTIYQYDEVYDEMECKKDEHKAVNKKSKKPKYMDNILKAHVKRKQENDQRIDRKALKKLEADGDKFSDKESFVTPAYRQHIEEQNKLYAEQERIDRLEEICDVTKQQDMSGFYLGLYSQTIDRKNDNENNELVNKNHDSTLTGTDKDDISSSSSCSDSEDAKKKFTSNSTSQKNRQYRKRAIEEEEEDSMSDNEQDDNNQNNVDTSPRDSEHRIAEDTPPAEKKTELSLKPENKNEINTTSSQSIDEKKDTPDINLQSKSEVTENLIDIKKKKDKKVSIWEKRTVGEVYNNAVQRYHARKSLQAS